MKVKGDYDRRTGRDEQRLERKKKRTRETGLCVWMLTRAEDENAIDLSSIVLPDHVLRALISIDLLSLFPVLYFPFYFSSLCDYHYVDNHKRKRPKRNRDVW